MAELMNRPSCLKTILRTKKRGIKIHLLANWTLHLSRFSTARSPTFLLLLHMLIAIIISIISSQMDPKSSEQQQIQQKSRSILMSKQKLAELVQKKIQEKKEQEEKNRPHREVLQLLVRFQVQDYNQLTKQIEELNREIEQQQHIFDQLTFNLQQFENTGKKNYPRIIVKPEFIASDNIPPLVKQFYRKSSNTYLRQDLLRKKQYELDTQLFESIKDLYEKLKAKQEQIAKDIQVSHRIKNQKRVRNLKEDLRLRSIKQEQQNIKKITEEERFIHRDLIAEYELKKVNLHKRERWAEDLIGLIQNQKQIIEKTYNPVTYRDYLKKIFNIRTKNESLNLNFLLVSKKLEEIQAQNERKTFFLEKNDNLFKIGKCSDSPSKKKRFNSQNLKRAQKLSRTPNFHLTHKKKTVNSEMNTPKKMERSGYSTGKDKSLSTSLGRTTASLKNFSKNNSASRRSYSVTTQGKIGGG